MCYYWELVRHFFVSNSRHGTHSPFVYGLASSVIYQDSRVEPDTVNVPTDFNPKYRDLLSDILSYMNISELTYVGRPDHAEALFVDLAESPLNDIAEAIRRVKVVVIHEPFRTRETKRKWRKLMRSADVVVSINLFHFGLLMHRKGQRKEDFVLRYPFWRKSG